MNVIALHAGALGDCVLALHTLHALSRSWNASSVTLVARSPIARWARRHGLVAETLPFDHPAIRGLYTPDPTLPAETATFLQRFDRVVSFLGGFDDPVSCRLAMPNGPDLLAIDPRPDPAETRRGTHITQQWIKQIEAHAGAAAVRPAAINLNDSERASRGNRLARSLGTEPGRVVLCHPGSGGLEKCCPIEILIQLVELIGARGWVVGWMVGPDEVERFGRGYVERLGESAPVLFDESVDAAADLVAGAMRYIGHDAGMTHVAALAGVPTLALFGPTDARVWRPLGVNCQVLGFPPADVPVHAWITKVFAWIEQETVSDHPV
ncbi:MAG: glycosyltransferase family 9 protein [Phycisphaerae bacterium]|jgi:ADP-heptose:LPS heptosyltransferase